MNTLGRGMSTRDSGHHLKKELPYMSEAGLTWGERRRAQGHQDQSGKPRATETIESQREKLFGSANLQKGTQGNRKGG